MHTNEQTLHRLYEAFAALDGEAMAQCYAVDAQFDDEAFSLRGRTEVGGMWCMLCDGVKAKGRDVWKIETSGIQANAQSGADSQRSPSHRTCHHADGHRSRRGRERGGGYLIR